MHSFKSMKALSHFWLQDQMFKSCFQMFLNELFEADFFVDNSS